MTGQESLKNYSSKEALAAGFDLQAPFALTDLDPSPLGCEKILRVLPGKRLVLLADAAGEKVILKLMGHGAYAKRELNLELEGSRALTSAGILTPDIVDHAANSNSGISYISFQFLEQATNLSELFHQASETQRKELLEVVFKIIARMHNAGIYQHDIHLDNFVLHNESVYTLDCASVITNTHSHSGIEDKTAISNLGLFIAQLYPHLDELTESCFTRYLELRQITNIDFPQVYRSAVLARNKRMHRYRRKIFKSSSEHIRLRNWREYRVCCRNHYDPEMKQFLDNPDPAIDAGVILKAGNSATVARVSIGSKYYVIKRYNVKNYWHGFKRLFQTSRAWRSWRSAYSLKLLDIDTPEAVALLEKRFGPLRKRSYLVCDYLEPERGAHLDQLIKNGLTKQQGQNLFHSLFKKMSKSLVSHGDFKATNFFIQGEKIFVLDLDAMTLHYSKTRCQKALKKDQKRFAHNWIKA